MQVQLGEENQGFIELFQLPVIFPEPFALNNSTKELLPCFVSYR